MIVSGVQGFTRAAYRGMLSVMRRAITLAMGLACACTAAPAPAPSVDHTTTKPATRATATNALGLVDGATWTWSGSRTTDAGTTPLSLTTKISGDGARWRVTGWPGYEADDARVTEIVIDRGVVTVDGEPWIRIAPRLEPLPCPTDDYCWTIENREITYRTGPDVMIYRLDGDRGVAGFTYHHNGTLDDVELQR